MSAFGGGFIAEDEPFTQPTGVHPGSLTSVTPSPSAGGSNSDNVRSQINVRKLSEKETGKLRTYLDEQLLQVERDVNKRTSPTSPIPTLQALLARLEPLLNIILSIPPIDPTTYIRISYLLNLTSSLRGWLSSYDLIPHLTESKQTTPLKPLLVAAASAMEDLLAFIEQVEEGWKAVLNGEAWDVKHRRGTDREGSWRIGSVEPGGSGGQGRGEAPRVRQAILGKEMSVTDKIRLRSSILSLRERLLTWSENQRDILLSPGTSSRQARAGTADSSAASASEVDAEVEEEEDATKEQQQSLKSWDGEMVTIMNSVLESLAL